MSDGWLERHPWLATGFALMCGLANLYEAIYIRPDSVMSIVDWVFGVVGLMAFLGLLVNALSDYF
jgi:hypothetical protein